MAKHETKVRKIYVPTTTRLKGSLDRVIGNLRGAEPFLSRETTLSQQAIVNASWLWMASMKPEDLARELAPHIAKFEAIWTESHPDELPDNLVAHDDGGPEPPRRRKSR